MEFGVQFFPAVGPDRMSGEQYFREALELIELSEALGYVNVRTVEHYFHPYGGYSPNPLVFLAAAAARTRTIRLVTGAVLPVFNNPLKLAGEIAMVDAISDGRLEIGFARAFLPQEFQRFGIELDESRARFDEGLEAVTRLLEEENVAFEGTFHRFPPTTSLPRPTQLPRPPFWVAALATEESFVNAGRLGHSVMTNPLGGPRIRELLAIYREAWREAGHPGDPRVMLAFFMVCDEDRERAIEIAKAPLERWLAGLADAAGDWVGGSSSSAYPGYDKLVAKLAEATFETQLAQGAAWVGTPDDIREQIAAVVEDVGDFDIASLQVSFDDMPLEVARRSAELFAREVMPAFATAAAGR